jgi:GNAT superfamily N-acetyltransferase
MPAMDFSLDTAQAADAAAIADLVNQAYRPGPAHAGWTHESALVSGDRTSAAQVRALFKKDSTVLVMRQGSALVACVHVERDGSVCWIGMLATSPALQAQGLGKQMLAAAEAFAIKTHAAKAFRMSVLSSRPELLDFYQRRGYQWTGATSAYPIEAGVGTPQRDDLQVLALLKLVG